MNFIISAPGKIILCGEHAVVYGYKAIASSINLRCQAQVNCDIANQTELILRLANMPFEINITEAEFNLLKSQVEKYNQEPMSSAYQSILSDYLDRKILSFNIEDKIYIKTGLMVFVDLCMVLIQKFLPIEIIITSEFSYGCGLGSSAAYSTVLSSSLLLLSNKISLSRVKSTGSFIDSDLDLISKYSFRGEQIVHGNPSGIDNSISTYGGSMLVQRLSSTGSIGKTSLNVPSLRVLLIDTKIKRCTSTVVKFVKKLMQENPKKYHAWFQEIQNITESLEIVIGSYQNDIPSFINDFNELIEENQRWLQLIGVSHSEIEKVINILKCYGIISKLTGAGWGGCVFGVVNEVNDSQLEIAIKHLSDNGFNSHITNLNCDGVNIGFL